MMARRILEKGMLCLVVLSLLAACVSSATQTISSKGNAATDQVVADAIQVVATTTIVGDVVKNIGGDTIALKVLVPTGADEHTYEPTAQDLVAIHDAGLIFYNGAGLEPFMERLFTAAGNNTAPISVSEGVALQQSSAVVDEHAEESAGLTGDPHVWTDPNNVMVWVDNIETALVKADPQNQAQYKERADAYRQELKTLDQWIQAQVEQLPQERRKLVTDHTVFTYFANRYGFEQVGAVVPGYSTLASPSAQEIAALEDSIRALRVPVIFTGSSFNPALAQQVANDTGTRLVQVQTGSLTSAEGPAPTYLEYMRFNVNTIVGALK